ncbi:helix-turn-helix domain-containing protein [Labilibacter sediminis]|nr:helix-turn-helix domain-containing protein [Labilibacter sediminis]
MVKLFFTYILLLIASSWMSAQDYHFEYFSSKREIFGERILEILKSNDDYLWVSGIEGISKFDAHYIKNFQTFANDSTSGIYGYRLFSLFEDDQRQIWVSTEKGLHLFKPKTNSFTRIPLPPDFPTRFTYIGQYKANQLLISTNTDSYIFDAIRHKIIDKKLPFVIKAELKDHKGQVWQGTQYGEILKNDSLKFKVKGIVSDMFMTNNGHLYISTDNGLYVVKQKHLKMSNPSIQHFYIGRKSTSISHKDLSSIAYYDEHIWIGSRSGLNQVILDQDQLPKKIVKHYYKANNPHSISNNQISDLYADNEGILWIATYNGLNKLDPSRQWFNALQYDPVKTQSLHDNNIFCIHGGDNGTIWMSGFNSGLSLFDPTKKTFHHFHQNNSNLHSDHIKHITTCSMGNTYFYNEKGISFLPPNSTDFQSAFITNPKTDDTLNIPIKYLYEIKENEFWLASNKTLYKAIKKGNLFSVSKFISLPKVTNIKGLTDIVGRFWLATDKGLFLIFPKNAKRTKLLSDEDNLQFKSSYFTDINYDSDKNIWITSRHGLYSIDHYQVVNKVPEKFSFKSYFVENGLPSNNAVGILSDQKGRLWISTWKGIVRYDSYGEDGHFTIYDYADGLISEKYTRNACYKDDLNNTFYFGGVNGVNFITPQNESSNSINQSLTFNTISSSGFDQIEKEFTVDKGDTLYIFQRKDISDWKLDLHYHSLLSENHHFFKWQFLHPDSTIHYTSSPEISFQNMKNGEYLIHMTPILLNGESGQSKIVQLKVKYPNYWLIYVFVSFVLIILSFLSYRYHKQKNIKPKYRYSSLSKDESTIIFERLESYMKHEKVFLNPKLSVDELTEKLDVSNVTFSQVLNKFKNIGFYEYVNNYRVEEFKDRLKEDKLHNLTLLGLAEECGFSSKSSFYRAFKKATNMTPAQYEKMTNSGQ